MPVKSLVDLATAACIKNIRHLESVGDYLPYENVRQILWRVDNAPQLRRIELNSPQIDGRTGEIWLKLIEREFPIEYKAQKYKPQNPSKWYRVWEKYKREHDAALEESENKLKNAFAGLRQDKEKNTSRIVERRLLPRTGRTVSRRTGGGGVGGSSTLNFTAGSRTKMLNGASIMRKVRREVKEIANIHGSLSRSVRGNTRISEVRKAPQAMINEHRRATQPSNEPSKYRPVKVSSAVTEHEKRATFISDSEDDDQDDDDDMWDEPPKKQPARPTAAPRGAAKSAAASLLKTRPAAATTSRTVRPAERSADTSRASSSSSSRPAASRPQPTTQSPAKASSAYDQSSRAGRPPPLSSYVGPASPPADAPPPSAGSPESRPRKRKAVDIFMRPKKR